MFRISGKRIQVAAAALVAVLAAAAGASQARADTVPAASFSIRCPDYGYWGNRIAALPQQLSPQPGTGVSGVIVDDSGATSSSAQYQYIYYRVWGYSYKYQAWFHSTYKRSYMGSLFSIGGIQAYIPRLGSWAAAELTSGDDYGVMPTEVAISPNSGTGMWAISVEVYWAPPWTGSLPPSFSSPDPPSGGLRTYLSAASTCTF